MPAPEHVIFGCHYCQLRTMVFISAELVTTYSDFEMFSPVFFVLEDYIMKTSFCCQLVAFLERVEVSVCLLNSLSLTGRRPAPSLGWKPI